MKYPMISKSIKRLSVILLLGILFLSGCKNEAKEEPLRELPYTVLSKENIPTPLLDELEVRKKEEFRITYEDGEYLYLCVGYGQQESGGYSIQVKELGLYEEHILLDTTLIGPEHEEAAQKVETYPYAVLRTEIVNLPVIFE